VARQLAGNVLPSTPTPLFVTTQFEIVTNVEVIAPWFMEAGSASTPTPPLLLAVQRSRMSDAWTVIDGSPLYAANPTPWFPVDTVSRITALTLLASVTPS